MALDCQLAKAQLSQWTVALKDPGIAAKVGTLVKAGFLASAKTSLRNIGGSATLGGTEYLAARPLAVQLDVIQATLKSAATFGKIKPHEFRTIANTASIPGLKQGFVGIREGLDRSVTLLRTGLNVPFGPGNIQKDLLPGPLSSQGEYSPGEQFGLSDIVFKTAWLEKSTRAVFNVLEAQDKPFYGFGFHTSLYGRARLMGIREGLKGKALAKRTDELLADPTEEMVMGAHADAQYVTLKNRTTMSQGASNARNFLQRKAVSAEPGLRAGAKIVAIAFDITAPFTKVASAIVMAGIDYSPAGVLKGLVHSAADRDPKVQAQFLRSLSRGTIGSGLTWLGYQMYGNGTMTGSYPTNPSERKLWEAEQKTPNSILINGRWRTLTWLGPLAMPMLLGANMKRFSSSDEAKEVTEVAAFAVGSMGKTLTEMSYTQGLNRVIEGLQDPGKAANAIAGMIPIPAIVGQVATVVDPVGREAITVREKVQARIPFASKLLPAKTNVWGEEVQKTRGGVRGAAEVLFDITNPKDDKSTPLTKEMARLNMGPSGVGSSYSVKGKKIQRSPEEIRALTKEIGPEYRTQLEAFIQTDRYLDADDDKKEKLLRRTMESIKRPVYKRQKDLAPETAFERAIREAAARHAARGEL